MSFEDLEEARAKRAEKEKAPADKSKRGRKRKKSMIEAGMLDPETLWWMNEVLTPMLEPEPEPEPTRWKAPVARMY